MSHGNLSERRTEKRRKNCLTVTSTLTTHSPGPHITTVGTVECKDKDPWIFIPPSAVLVYPQYNTNNLWSNLPGHPDQLGISFSYRNFFEKKKSKEKLFLYSKVVDLFWFGPQFTYIFCDMIVYFYVMIQGFYFIISSFIIHNAATHFWQTS